MKKGRLNRERKTLRAMIGLFCRAKHRSVEELCRDCVELWAYAQQRLDRCPYQEEKPTCAKCPIHCYNPAMRARVREVMRASGPAMMLHHPILTARHYLDEFLSPRPKH